ncbi:MAG: hypothetical protein GC134_05685 [Proteobacteria bacterium]|nr:hypothetical protein [Pseudomonadota bacterium]
MKLNIFGSHGHQSPDDQDFLKAALDLKTAMFFLLLIIVAALLVIYPLVSKDGAGKSTESATAFRPVGLPLRVQVTWDSNLDASQALQPGQMCLKPGDRGFDINRRPPECSAADVDLWMQRVTPEGERVLYAANRKFPDGLMAYTPDDRGIAYNKVPTTFRAEQMVPQYSVLPKGEYTINIDLFRPDAYRPDKPVKVCAIVIYAEGAKDKEKVLYRNCRQLGVDKSFPREVTLVSFRIGDGHNLVEGSVDTRTQVPLAVPYYAVNTGK